MPDTLEALDARHIPSDWTAPLSLSEDLLNRAQPVVIALAGAGCSPAIYRDLDSVCSIPWRTLDWFRGEGAFDPVSIADRIAVLLARRAGPTFLAGHSLGAFLSLLIGLRHGASLGRRLSGLILSNTGARTVGHGDPGLPDRILHHWTPQAQQAFLDACFHEPPPEPLAAHLRNYLAAVPVQRLHAAVAGLRVLDVLHELPGLRLPVLVAHGELDRKRSVQTAREMAQALPRGRLVLLLAGHTPMVECPTGYHRAIQTFLTDLGSS
ncbi:MAG: alpha/beta fold hydrolase [Burkholderiaceae bacterium]